MKKGLREKLEYTLLLLRANQFDYKLDKQRCVEKEQWEKVIEINAKIDELDRVIDKLLSIL